MKAVTIGLVVLSIISIFTSCKKANNSCSLTHAKVLRYDCDRVILQVLDNSIQGDAEWTDVMNGNTYNNVVSYHNTCAFASATNNAVSEIFIEAEVVAAPVYDGSCIQCMALSANPPQTRINIARFSSGPCDAVK